MNPRVPLLLHLRVTTLVLDLLVSPPLSVPFTHCALRTRQARRAAKDNGKAYARALKPAAALSERRHSEGREAEEAVAEPKQLACVFRFQLDILQVIIKSRTYYIAIVLTRKDHVHVCENQERAVRHHEQTKLPQYLQWS